MTDSYLMKDDIQNHGQNVIDTAREPQAEESLVKPGALQSTNFSSIDRDGKGVMNPILHEGSGEDQSTIKQSSEFTVRSPIVQVELPDSPVVESDRRNERPLRVLVVDDNVDTVLSFSMLLRAFGHEVQSAHDGRKAVQVAVDYCPDVVLLDIGLPGLNGYEVARQIRQHLELKHVVLVALTGYGQDSGRLVSDQAGFTHHLIKPASFEELQTILATVAEQVAKSEPFEGKVRSR